MKTRQYLNNLLLVGGLVASLIAITGCTSQKVSIDEKTAELGGEPVFKGVERLAQEDFAFPPQKPLLSDGKAVYTQNCASCHAAGFWQTPGAQKVMTYSTPIDGFLMLTTGKAPEVSNPSAVRPQVLPATHPAFRDKLSRDQRWAVLFYTRYLAGMSDSEDTRLKAPNNIASIFGGNCAVCHGKNGLADGTLQTGHPPSHELARARISGGLFEPRPANFTEFNRFYNRTDAQLFKYIGEGIYPSGMPAWYGNKDTDNNFTFDETVIWKLVRHVRTFTYKNDLDNEVIPKGAIPAKPPSFNPQIPAVPPIDRTAQSAEHGEE